MTYRTAKMSPAIFATTIVVFTIVLGLFIAAVYMPAMLLVAGFTVVVCVTAYLFIPVGYELSNDRLVVLRHIGSREFSPVLKCSPVSKEVCAVRLFGNSGFFGGTGFFWSRQYGFFRAYVTTARRTEMVLVETARQKILISPENTTAFLSPQRDARG